MSIISFESTEIHQPNRIYCRQWNDGENNKVYYQSSILKGDNFTMFYSDKDMEHAVSGLILHFSLA